MWKLTIEDDEGKQTALPLAHEEYALGRGEPNAIRLTDRNISRSHAILKKSPQGWFLKDLQSYNGTYVNGVRVVGEQLVSSGDLVQIGDYRLELVDDAATATSAPNPSAPSNQVPPVHQRPNRLVVVVGPTPGAEFPLDKELFTIGRSEEATISINHSSVSRIHAELIALGGGRFEIVDKASANGIRINGVELKRGILEAGDALELGDVRLRFVGAGKIFRAGADQSQQLAAAAFETGTPSGRGSGAGRSSVGFGKLVGLGVLAGIVVIVIVAAMLLRGNAAPSPGVTPEKGVQMTDDAAKQKLAEAQALFNAKDFEGAHQKAIEIPESSAIRDDPAFRDIEAAWADAMFRRVEQAPDSAQKKSLLKEINATPSVDAERRKKAADMVADIEAKEPPPPAPNLATGEPHAALNIGSGAPSTTAAKVDPSAVASNPSEYEQQRKDLEPRVLSGRASIDEIKKYRALCRHLGNTQCRDKADAILKKREGQSP